MSIDTFIKYCFKLFFLNQEVYLKIKEVLLVGSVYIVEILRNSFIENEKRNGSTVRCVKDD